MNLLARSIMLATTTFLAFGLALAPTTAKAEGFDWGSDCSTGDGQFSQYVPQGQSVSIGVIPAGKRALGVRLASAVAVDIQLVDVATGTQIIAWPRGIINGANEACATYEGATYCYRA